MESSPIPVDLPAWVASCRAELQPPVGNKLLFGAGQLKAMVVGGPNARRDFHVEAGEELFLMLEGAMTLEAVERGRHPPRAVAIGPGEAFMLPAHTPHSPQRLAGTVGLVLERARRAHERDALRWYARDGSGRVLYEETFHCTDLGTQLRPVIERFNASEQCRSGEPAAGSGTAGAVVAGAEAVRVDADRDLGEPVNLRAWAAAHPGGGVLFGEGADEAARRGFEYCVAIKSGPDAAWEADWQWARGGGELFLYQIAGEGELDVLDTQGAGGGSGGGGGGGGGDGEVASGAVATHALRAGHVMLLPAGGRFRLKARWRAGGDCLCLVVTNSVVC